MIGNHKAGEGTTMITTLLRARSNEIAILPGGTTSAIGDDTVS